MEAVNCLKEKKRMCNIIGCSECGLSHFNNGHSILCHFFLEEFPEEAVSIIEEWSKTHPVQTNADKIKEVFAYCPAITKNQYGDEYLHIPKGWLDAPYEVPKGGKEE